MNYYNEIDSFAADWLEELMAAGEIPLGYVDRRSIRDVSPDDLDGFTQAHFFAGIGGWAYALRLAGWPDDRPAWTGSCPCQPFSDAGKRGGFTDDRHLWPEFHRLIAICKPPTVFGEQVASPSGQLWLESLRVDMEDTGYAVGAADLCAAGVGAPHRRQRLYWGCASLADSRCELSERRQGEQGPAVARAGERHEEAVDDQRSVSTCAVRVLADAEHAKRWPEREIDGGAHRRNGSRRSGDADRLAHADSADILACDTAVRGFWRDASWVLTRPQRVGDRPGLRPVERGAFPLAHGVPARLGRLRGYGNAIVAPLAAEFILAFDESVNSLG